VFDLSIVKKSATEADGFVLDVKNGQIQLVSSLEWLRQKIRNLLETWQGEWFLDTSYGIDYKSQIGKSRQEIILLEIKSKISEIDEVSEVLRCNASYSNDRMYIDLSVVAKGEVLNFKVAQNV
tara:strand:+ start:261 stop:629 length:369 start_codon:yes stop_codon:yes gene_type:complete